MSVEIDLDTTQYEITIAHTLRTIPELGSDFTLRSALIVKDEMESNVPVKTGKLRRNIVADISGESATVGTNTGYGLFVDLPTRPHIIRARDGGYLRIPLPNGQIIFRKQVFHTGTKGAFFRRATLISSAPKIQESLQQRLNEVFR